jgi:nitroreductase
MVAPMLAWRSMDLLDVMRTTFACREFTDEPVRDAALYRIFDAARFAPSGGNRQGWRVVVVRDGKVRQRMAELVKPIMRRYVAEMMAGEAPFNALVPSKVDDATVAKTPLPDAVWRPLVDAPVVLVVGLDLTRVTSFDRHLPRPGVVSGASVYPFVWNLLLAARTEGYAGVITTYLAPDEAEVRRMLGLPESFALAAAVPLGRPKRVLTRLRRDPVESFAVLERWNGKALRP